MSDITTEANEKASHITKTTVDKPSLQERASDDYQQCLEQYAITPLTHFDRAREDIYPQKRLENVRTQALKLREQLLSGPKVSFYKSVDLIRVPYPTKYGLANVTTVPTPFVHILNRLFIVQFKTPQGLKTLLFSPSDIEGNRETPFFKNLSESAGPLRPFLDRFLAPKICTVEQALEQVGISPEQVDYISYDHLHTQDLRKWLGADGKAGYFPNARLLVMKQEWASTQALLPNQAYWYCPNGIAGIDESRVIQLESSVFLGDGVALVQSPGHTEGNHSLVVHTDQGLLVTSENGISADNYAPLQSDIPGVRQYAQASGAEVVLNGNTQERGLDQYISMVMEKTIAGPHPDIPAFFNVVPSSEMTAYWGFPGIKPTFSFGELEFGFIQRR